MALENLVGADKFLSALVPANPVGADDKREGDDHVRGIKNVLRNSFPNVTAAVTATSAELSTVASKVNRAGDTMTGALAISAAVPEFKVNRSGGGAGAFGYAWSTLGVEFASVRADDVSGEMKLTAGFAGFGGRMVFATNGAECARFPNSGELLLGVTATFYGAGVGTINIQNNAYQLALRNGAATAGKYWTIGQANTNDIAVLNAGGVGAHIADGATAWSAASDERQKAGFVEFTDALGKVCTLRAGTGRYTYDKPDVSRSFLIAQDVQRVLPEAVSEGSGGMLRLAYTDLVPLLVAAVQELRARVAELER